MLNVFTLAAAAVVAHMLPPRLARLKIPVAATVPVVTAAPVLAAALPPGGDAASTDRNDSAARMPTRAGLSGLIASSLPASAAGPDAGIMITDAVTGKVLYSKNGYAPAAPASTNKVVTAVAALAVLGPQARFTTSVKLVPACIVLVGGGDPTLAVNSYPPSDYPQPATLAALAAKTATALRAAGRKSVQLGYDTSLYSGPSPGAGMGSRPRHIRKCHANHIPGG